VIEGVTRRLCEFPPPPAAYTQRDCAAGHCAESYDTLVEDTGAYEVVAESTRAVLVGS
jgi:hypothetical protein